MAAKAIAIKSTNPQRPLETREVVWSDNTRSDHYPLNKFDFRVLLASK